MRSLTVIVAAMIATAISAKVIRPVPRQDGGFDCSYYNGQPCSATTYRGCCDPGVSTQFIECDTLNGDLYLANMPWDQICKQQPTE
jgi:hypothetical protein